MRTIRELLQNRDLADIKDAYFMRKKHVEKKRRKELIDKHEREKHKNQIMLKLSPLFHKITPSQERQLRT